MQNLILLHGALGSAAQYVQLIPHLEKDFHIQTFNFSGHGNKPLSGEFGIPVFAEELSAFIEKHQIASPSIFGYSMGGYVALYASLVNPGRISRVFTLGTKFLWTTEYAALETKKLNPEKIVEKVPAFAEDLKKRHTEMDWRELLSKTGVMMTGLGKNNLLTVEKLSGIAIPVRIGVGDKDNTVSVEESAIVARSVRGAELEVFPSTTHPLEKASPERLEFSIREFCGKG